MAEIVKSRPMKGIGNLSHEYEAAMAPGELWEVYGTMQLAYLIKEVITEYITNIEVVEGDGAVGTVLRVTFRSGPPAYWKEKFVKIDNEQCLRDYEVIEGGYLDLGLTSYKFSFQIIGKTSTSSVIISTLEYEIGDDLIDDVPTVDSYASMDLFAAIHEGVVKHLMEKKTSDMSSLQD